MNHAELTKSIAIYQSPYGGFIVCEHRDGEKDSTEYVRVTEPITVTFTARKQAEVMAAAVKALDLQIVEAQQVIRRLETKKSELLALPAPGEPA